MFITFKPSARLHRLTAVLGIALVLALNVLAVWPEGHAWLHGEHSPPTGAPDEKRDAAAHFASASPGHDDDDNCVVVRFSHGHGGSAPLPLLLADLARVVVASNPAGHAIRVRPPPHFLPPGCGPPAV